MAFKPPLTPPFYQLQCWCPPTENFEPLLDCDYETEEEGIKVFEVMKKDKRDVYIRLVRQDLPWQRAEFHVVREGYFSKFKSGKSEKWIGEA